MEVAYCRKARNFRVDSKTCAKFSGKVVREPKDSQLIVRANWQKGGVALGVASN